MTTEDLKKILDQSTQVARLCTSPILVSVDELQKSVDKFKGVKVPPQEPPKTTKTTTLLLLPPPSPPKSITQALQEPSAVAGAATDLSVQTIGTPQAIDKY